MTLISRKQIHEAAVDHAIKILGEKTFNKNKNAANTTINQFIDAAEWALNQVSAADTPDEAIDMLAREQREQVERGFDAAHDDQYTDQELAVTAILLLAEGTGAEKALKKVKWPVEGYPDKRGKLDRVRQLVIAGGLIAAEIKRVIREFNKVKEVAA